MKNYIANKENEICQLKINIKKVEEHNVTLQKHNRILKSKLIKCGEHLKSLYEEMNKDVCKSNQLISQLNKENEYLKRLLKKNIILLRNSTKESKKLKKTKTIDLLESDNEDSQIGLTVKLLAVKYKFERMNDYWKYKRNNKKNKRQTTKPGKQLILVERKRPPEKKVEEHEIEEIDISINDNINKSMPIIDTNEKQNNEDEEVNQKRWSSYSFS